MIKKRLSIKSKYNWPLMKNNISQADKKVLLLIFKTLNFIWVYIFLFIINI